MGLFAMRHIRLWGVLFWLVSCSTATPPPDITRQQQVVDGVTITLERATDPQLNQAQRFTITLIDAQNTPIDGADVYLDLTMPADPMGTNQPIATAQGAGVYTAQSAFIMAGDWTITVITTINEVEHRAVFEAVVTK
jgi:nitrogen fixation protein FixH